MFARPGPFFVSPKPGNRTSYCRLLAGRDLSGPTCVNPLESAGSLDRVEEPKFLTLRELEALARALLPVLLAFLHTGIAR